MDQEKTRYNAELPVPQIVTTPLYGKVSHQELTAACRETNPYRDKPTGPVEKKK